MVGQQCLLTPNLGLQSTAQAGQEDASPSLIMGGWVVKKPYNGGITTYISSTSMWGTTPTAVWGIPLLLNFHYNVGSNSRQVIHHSITCLLLPASVMGDIPASCCICHRSGCVLPCHRATLNSYNKTAFPLRQCCTHYSRVHGPRVTSRGLQAT